MGSQALPERRPRMGHDRAGALAVERAVDDVLAGEALPPEERDHVDAVLRRMTVRIADAWARAGARS